jgi:hypothetical protein
MQHQPIHVPLPICLSVANLGLFNDQAVCTQRDNTGRGEYVDAVFPTLDFPSDHALVRAQLSR